MNAFLPHDWNALLPVGGLLAAVVLIGFTCQRFASSWLRAVVWGTVVTAVVLAESLTAREPAGLRMLAIIAALLYGMKGVVGVESRLSGAAPLGVPQWLAFVCGWFGMRPQPFAALPGESKTDAGRHLGRGAGFLLLGATCFMGAGNVPARTGAPQVVAVAALVMLGFSLAVHFGLFEVLTALWRALGVNVTSLFRGPLRSRSLTEFWGRRWNLAFSEMATLAVYRPLKSVVGPAAASTAAFLFSGLVHELAISVPARGGYGLPLAYFALHAAAMRLEAGALGKWLDARPGAGRLWTAAWILLPLPLLFHPPFVRAVVLPLAGR